jgi:hypothetical protein
MGAAGRMTSGPKRPWGSRVLSELSVGAKQDHSSLAEEICLCPAHTACLRQFRRENIELHLAFEHSPAMTAGGVPASALAHLSTISIPDRYCLARCFLAIEIQGQFRYAPQVTSVYHRFILMKMCRKDENLAAGIEHARRNSGCVHFKWLKPLRHGESVYFTQGDLLY